MCIRDRANERALEFSFLQDHSQHPVPVWIKTDEAKLRQVLVNLIGNALKFTHFGFVKLVVSCSEVKGSSKLNLVFKIQDSGCGIAPDKYEAAFGLFEQVGHAELSSQGTGLGLSLSRQFARLLEGDITVSSELNKGSCFTFNLAIQTDANNDVIEKRMVDKLKLHQPTLRVLVVDDHSDHRTLLNQLLTSVGFKVREAFDGIQCIEIFKQWQPNVILMDIRMPKMDGLEAAKIIKAEPSGQQTSIIAITASALDEERNEILESGINEIFLKPFSHNDLLLSMGRLLKIQYTYLDLPKKLENAIKHVDSDCSNEQRKPEKDMSNMKVLVVDDIKPNRMLLMKMLANQGYDCQEACDGEEAISLIKSWHPDLIFFRHAHACSGWLSGFGLAKRSFSRFLS